MNVLAILAKAPNPNEVKTRLVPPLDPETAASLYRNFLLDKLEQVKNIKGTKLFLAYTPREDKAFFKKIAARFTLISQVGTNLGERLANLSYTLFNRGFKKVVLLDSDTPNLPLKYIRHALRRLDRFDVTLGPCEDGGYYLIGLRSNVSGIFEGIPWSTSRVVESTIQKALTLGLTISLIDRWYDVDTLEDLIRLKKNLESSWKRRKANFCENTYRFISEMNIELEP